MLYLFVVLSVASIVWGTVRIIKGWTAKKICGEPHTDGECCAIVLGSICTVLLLIILPLIAMSNGNKLKKLEAFYDANSRNYEIAIDETASYLSSERFVDLEKALVPIEGSIERLEQARYVSERIREWRDAVNDYNITIASMQYYNENLFTGILVPDRVRDVKLLVID